MSVPPSESSTTQLYGFPALFEELATQGVSKADVLKHALLSDRKEPLDVSDRIALFRSAQALAPKPETALLAGARQRISNYGVYGYALASSATVEDAFRVIADFFPLSGSFFRITLDVKGNIGIFTIHQPESLGPVLPFIAEYWRSSQTQIFSSILGRPFPSLDMHFPYAAPSYASLYADFLNCRAFFESDRMEWRFDAGVLSEPCLNADPDTADLCKTYCEQFVDESDSSSNFQRDILRLCLPSLETGVDAGAIARSLNMSVRTFYRRLSDEGATFKSLVDRLRCSVATEYLRNTRLPVEEISVRCGYQDVSNFRKAFRRWTGRAPSSYRADGERRHTSSSP